MNDRRTSSRGKRDKRERETKTLGRKALEGVEEVRGS